VGILTPQDIIIPVGVFQSGKWKTSWPKAGIDSHFTNDSGEPLPKILPLDKVPAKWLPDGIKIPRNWILLGGGSDQRNLTVEEATEFESHCSTVWGLRASFIGTGRRPEHVNPKVGVVGMVTSGITKARVCEAVGPNSSESKALLTFLRKNFDLAEEQAIRKAGGSLNTGHPTAKGKRILNPLKAKNVSKIKTERPKQTLYFISIVREYENPDCPAESLYNVWMLRNDQKYKILSADMILTDCDRKEGSWIYPVGIVSIESREYIVSEELGYESESYTIRMLDKGALKTVLFVRGGGC